MNRIVSAGLLLLALVPSATAAQEGVQEPVNEAMTYFSGVTAVQVVVAEVAIVGLVGLGLFVLRNGWGGDALAYGRGGSVFSLFVGIPATLVLLGLTFVGAIMMATVFGAVIGIPILGVVGGALAIWHSIGFIAVGTWLPLKLGIDHPIVGIVLGTGLAGGLAWLSMVSPVIGAFPMLVIGALGVGAGFRTTYARLTSGTAERTVPPKRQNIKQ